VAAAAAPDPPAALGAPFGRPQPPRRRVAFLIHFAIAAVGLPSAAIFAQTSAPAFDETRALSSGIRKLDGKYITLFTDVPSSPDIDNLPQVFDLAVPEWAGYFNVDKSKLAGWKARGFLIGDRRRFTALGLLPPGHEEFVNGISMGATLWLVDQPTAYYRRHLLLHEGTHVFMVSFLGGCGPGWYMEGIAELLATHRLDTSHTQRAGASARLSLPNAPPPTLPHLTLNIMPRDRTEVPKLGRIKLIHDAIADGRTLSLPTVMQTDNSKQLGNEAYAWCWAAAKFLDSHPRYRDRFRRLYKHVLDRKFNEIVRREFAADASDIAAEWTAYIDMLDHGFDFDRMAIDMQPGKPLRENESHKISIAADRGWQSSGVMLEAGKSYEVSAAGRYQIASEEIEGATEPWPCEPGGVTIEYHDSKPLGILIGAIDSRGEKTLNGQSGFNNPFAIGLQHVIRPQSPGTLYLRVNDSAGRLDDNRGAIAVTIGLTESTAASE
jgi:hypothetical protein